MKTIITTVLLFLFASAIGYAQTENNEIEVKTLFGSSAKVTGWWVDLNNSFPFIIGGGGAEYISQNLYPEIEDEGEIDYERKHMSSSPYWIAEPGANIEINVTGFMRLYAGYSYRWLMGLNLENTSATAFNGSNFNLGLKFGKF